MTETKFTPGPWMIFEESSEDSIIPNSINYRVNVHLKNGSPEQRISGGGYLLCQQFSTTNKEFVPELRANANLIAAAPDLYSCVRDMKRLYDFAFTEAVQRGAGNIDRAQELQIKCDHILDKAIQALERANGGL